MKSVKKAIHAKIVDILTKKIKVIENEIRSAMFSRDSDTKSSVGDKHETSRAKIQTEIDRLNSQLHVLNQQNNIISNVNYNKNFQKVDLGALVETNSGTYFICIGIGKMHVENQDYYLISLASPIGQLLNSKLIGDNFTYKNSYFEIINIF